MIPEGRDGLVGRHTGAGAPGGHGTGGRARHRRAGTAPAGGHGTGGRARHRRAGTAPAGGRLDLL
ncbi:MAG: hypothetical protein ABSA53_35430 [Streptosporangiaceae bacterium]